MGKPGDMTGKEWTLLLAETWEKEEVQKAASKLTVMLGTEPSATKIDDEWDAYMDELHWLHIVATETAADIIQERATVEDNSQEAAQMMKEVEDLRRRAAKGRK